MAHIYDPWPALPLDAWKDTYDTLHMWLQIVGKVRMALSPPMNHYWHVTLYLTSRGLTTSPIPYGDRSFEVRFDFVDHNLLILTSDAGIAMLPLASRPVADFYQNLMSALQRLGIGAHINTMPQEVPSPIPFEHDNVHATYDREYANRFWRILVSVDSVFHKFRGRFLGKCSPVHFFWGSCDLTVTRFSGRRGPARPDADRITQESYSHECCSAGWWPGGQTFGGRVNAPAFYSYTAPPPPGFAEYKIRPEAARYDATLGEFILMYDDVRRASSPRRMLLEFLQSTYEAGAVCANWDRANLEEPDSWPRGESYFAA